MSGHSAEKVAPVRVCCGQRHYGPVCPDGQVMCCLCFGRFPVEQLHRTLDGTPEDVCQPCAEREGWTGVLPPVEGRDS